MAVITVLAVFFVIASPSLAASVKAQNEITWVYDYPTSAPNDAGYQESGYPK